MYKCQLCDVEDFDDVLDLIKENALRVVSCFYIRDSRKICVMTGRDDMQPIAEIIKVRKEKSMKRKSWHRR